MLSLTYFKQTLLDSAKLTKNQIVESYSYWHYLTHTVKREIIRLPVFLSHIFVALLYSILQIF